MADGYGDDAFQWKNSSHRTYSLGIGISNTNTDDDTDRDVERDIVRDTARDVQQDTDRDVVTRQDLLSADQHDKLEDIVCDYYSHFDTMITLANRETIRDRSTDFWEYARNELYDAIYAETDNIVADERRQLEEALCSKITTLNSIGGSTRSCFAQTIIGRTLSDNSVAMASLKANANIQARQLEAQTIDAAFARSYQAFVEGDNADFNKYMQALQLLRGSVVDETVAEDIGVTTDEDINDVTNDVTVESINRDVNTLTLNSQYNRTAGDIADTSDTYVGDLNAIAAVGGALG